MVWPQQPHWPQSTKGMVAEVLKLPRKKNSTSGRPINWLLYPYCTALYWKITVWCDLNILSLKSGLSLPRIVIYFYNLKFSFLTWSLALERCQTWTPNVTTQLCILNSTLRFKQYKCSVESNFKYPPFTLPAWREMGELKTERENYFRANKSCSRRDSSQHSTPTLFTAVSLPAFTTVYQPRLSIAPPHPCCLTESSIWVLLTYFLFQRNKF